VRLLLPPTVATSTAPPEHGNQRTRRAPPNVATSCHPRTWEPAAAGRSPPNMETRGPAVETSSPRTWKLGGITSRPAALSALLGHPIAAILAKTAPDRGNGGRPWKRCAAPDHEKNCRHRGGSRLAPTDEFSHTTNCPGGPRLWKNTLRKEKKILGLTHTMPTVCLGDHAATIRPVEQVTRKGDER